MADKANMDIRMLMMQKGIRMWEIADKLGLSDAAFSKRLRKELPDKQRQQMMELIDEIAPNKGEVSVSMSRKAIPYDKKAIRQRAYEIITDYLFDDQESYARIDFHFEKSNGETQDKTLRWGASLYERELKGDLK